MYPTQTETDSLTPMVARVLKIEDVTSGDPKKDYLVRYRGQLYNDAAESYDQLAASLRPLDITPLFRNEEGKHAILLTPGTFQARPSNPWINLVFFLLTLVSVILVGAYISYDGPPANSLLSLIPSILHNWPSGIPYAIALLAILVTHEFGHYLVGRYHHAQVTLPYFIPMPFPPFGTMGAFIQLKEPPKNKRTLLDIGIAGPLAGIFVAIPVLLYGLSLSKLEPIQMGPGQAFTLEGNSILYLLAKFAIFHQLLPAPSSYGGLPPLLYWIKYFFTSQPLPIGGMDVIVSPIAWAGWAGILVTSLNLIPAGQLDGGHISYVLFGKRARMFWPFILAILVFLGFYWAGWWLWAVLIFLLGRLYAEPLDQITQLDPRRKALAVLGVILFFLVFTPVPLITAVAGGG